MKPLFAEHALLPDGWADNVRVTINSQGRIADVEKNATATADDSVLENRVLLPALCNLHSHAFQRAMAGMTEYRSTTQESFWSWRTLMYRFLDVLTPEQIEAIAALVYMEMLEAGYTAVGEFHYIHHQRGGEHYLNRAETSERIFAAAQQTGIGLTHLPVLYRYGGAGEQPLSGGQLRFGNDLDSFVHLVDSAHQTAQQYLPEDTRIGIAPHSLRAVSPGLLSKAAEHFSAGPIHIHIAEQLKEVAEIRDWLGNTPLTWLLDHIEVKRNWCLVHATHMTAQETAALAHSGAVVGLCPITEANLGDGIFNGAQFIAENGRWGIGSDSNIRITLAEELRLLEYSQRLRDHARNVLINDAGSVGTALYQQALTGGAQALARESGAIQAGLFADLVAIDTDDIAFCGLDTRQLLDGWLFAGDDRVVRDVWSAGRYCVREGRHIAREAIVSRYKAGFAKLIAII